LDQLSSDGLGDYINNQSLIRWNKKIQTLNTYLSRYLADDWLAMREAVMLGLYLQSHELTSPSF
jgi:hypothetical protein